MNRSGSRPTTPLRRLSASSLKALSLSHSLSRPPNTSEPPLAHLGPTFAELADAVADLAGNCEALNECNKVLDGWNEAFAGYLVGLRVDGYTADFDEAPTYEDFVSHAAKIPPPPSPPPPARTPSPSRSHDDQEPGNETTFVTGGGESEYSFMEKEATSGAGRGRGTARGRGRGGRGGPVGMSRREQVELLAFTDGIIRLLPITFREQQPQRGATEKILAVLRNNPTGVPMADLTSQTAVQTHRANESLTALVRAKIVIKSLVKGVTSYRLDPNKYPPR